MSKLIKLIFITLLFSGASVMAERSVTFRSEVNVGGRFVLLKDLILANNKITEDELNLIILEAPVRGSKRFAPIAIAYKMQEHKDLMDIVISSPPTVKVSRLTDIDLIENVKKSLIEQLKESPQWKDFNINLVFQNSDLVSLSDMSGADSYEIVSQSTSRNMDSIKLRVKFSEKDNSLGTISLVPTIQRELDMVFLVDPISKGDIITRSNVQIVKSWSDGSESGFCLSLEEALGYEVRKNLPAGSKIPVNILADPIYANKGDLITANITVGSLNVSMDGIALQQGRRGDDIRVRNINSKRIITVKLTGEGVGQIYTGGK